MKKPYFVDLRMTAVVMADNHASAERAAVEFTSTALQDGYSDYIVEELSSLRQLEMLGPEWSGDRVPYGGDHRTLLRDLLPAEPPRRCDRTADLFEAQA